MEAELEKIMILVQRKHNIIREMDRLTDDLGESVSRQDEVSASLILDMRAAEMAKCDECQGDLWDVVENSQNQQFLLEILKSDPFVTRNYGSFEEKKIFEIRQKTSKLLDTLKEKDKRISLRAIGEKSFYQGK